MAKELDLSGVDEILGSQGSSQQDPVSPSSSFGIQDALASLGEGATLGFRDEILGALKAAGTVATSDKKLEDLYNLYRQYQKEEEEGYKQIEAEHPTAALAGELAGGFLIPGGVFGQGAKAATSLGRIGQAAKAGAAIGAITGAGKSEGTVDDLEKLGKDVLTGGAGGAAIGGALGGAGELVKKGFEGLKKTGPMGENLAYSFERGAKKGEGFIGPSSEKRITGTKKELGGKFGEMMYGEEGPITQTSKEIGDYFSKATQKGAKVNVLEDENLRSKIAQTFQDLEDNNLLNPTKRLKDIEDPVLGDIFKALDRKGSVGQSMSSNEIKTFSSNVDALLKGELSPEETYKFARWLQGDEVPGMAKLGSSKFKQLIPDDLIYSLKEAAKQSADNALAEEGISSEKLFKKFGDVRSDTVETILNKGKPKKYSTIWQKDYGKSNVESKLYDEFQNIFDTLQDPSKAGDIPRDVIRTLEERVSSLKQNYPDLNFNKFDDLLKEIKDVSQQAVIRNKLIANTSHTGSAKGLMERGLDLVGYGGANIAGQSVNFGNKIAKAPDRVLIPIAQTLKTSPVVSHLGVALEQALVNNQQSAKNAAMFAIMQNPEARKAVEDMVE